MEIRQLSIFIENKTGRLSAVTKTLGDNGISIRAMSASDTIDYGILRLIVDKPDLALEKVKEAGFTATLTSAVAIGISDEPGALNKAMEVIGNNNLSVEYIYAFTNQHNVAYVILRFDDNNKAIDVLKTNGIQIVSQEDLESV